MGKHTAGPWHIGMQPGPIIYGPKGEQVADLRGERKTLVLELDEAVANTQLIAAAPDLLQALEALEVAVCTDEDHAEGLPFHYRGVIEQARQAIKQAKGE